MSYLSAFESSEQREDFEKAKVYFNLGILELNDDFGNLAMAKKHFAKAQAIFKRYNDDDYLAKTYIRQAGVYMRTSQFLLADFLLDEASKLNINERTGVSLALAKTKLERLKGNPKQALDSAFTARELALASGSFQQIERIQNLIKILQNNQDVATSHKLVP